MFLLALSLDRLSSFAPFPVGVWYLHVRKSWVYECISIYHSVLLNFSRHQKFYYGIVATCRSNVRLRKIMNKQKIENEVKNRKKMSSTHWLPLTCDTFALEMIWKLEKSESVNVATAAAAHIHSLTLGFARCNQGGRMQRKEMWSWKRWMAKRDRCTRIKKRKPMKRLYVINASKQGNNSTTVKSMIENETHVLFYINTRAPRTETHSFLLFAPTAHTYPEPHSALYYARRTTRAANVFHTHLYCFVPFHTSACLRWADVEISNWVSLCSINRRQGDAWGIGI